MKRTKKWRLVLFAVGLLVIFSFYLFSREVKRGFLKQTDFNITVKIQDKIPARFDGVWEDISFIVTPAPSVIIVGLGTLVALIDFKKKRIRLRALLIPLAFGLLIFGEMYGKSVVHHPAPPFFMIKNPTTIFPTYYINEQFSYPSGHTARAVFIGSLVSGVMYQVSRKRKIIFWTMMISVIYIGLVAIGRIYLGHHWLSDIIGGGLLGLGMAFPLVAVLPDGDPQ